MHMQLRLAPHAMSIRLVIHIIQVYAANKEFSWYCKLSEISKLLSKVVCWIYSENDFGNKSYTVSGHSCSQFWLLQSSANQAIPYWSRDHFTICQKMLPSLANGTMRCLPVGSMTPWPSWLVLTSLPPSTWHRATGRSPWNQDPRRRLPSSLTLDSMSSARCLLAWPMH